MNPQSNPPERTMTSADGIWRFELFATGRNDPWSRNKSRAAYQHAGLKYITEKRMTNATLRARFGLSADEYTKASAVIRDALDAGAIVPDDPANKAPRYAKYVPFWAAKPAEGTRAGPTST